MQNPGRRDWLSTRAYTILLISFRLALRKLFESDYPMGRPNGIYRREVVGREIVEQVNSFQSKENSILPGWRNQTKA